MNQNIAAAPIFVPNAPPMSASAIPALNRAEAAALAREELTRFMALLEGLAPTDWGKPTDCALWTVKDVVAHQASHVLALTRVREFLDQFNPLNFRDYLQKGMNVLDAANQRQVDQRASWSPEQLIAEIRDQGEASLARRQHFPFLLRWMPIRSPGYEHLIRIGELIDSIFTRDMWMHRVDICRATHRAMTQDASHDGRMTALVVRDLDRHLAPKLNGRAVTYRLTGKAGGEWIVGGSGTANAVLIFDTLEFHRLASGRITHQQAVETGLVKIDGDPALGALALQHTAVLY